MKNTEPYQLKDVTNGQAAVYSNHYKSFHGWVRRDNGGDELWRPLTKSEPYLDVSGSEEVVSVEAPVRISVNISDIAKNRMHAMEKMISKYPRITDKGVLTQRHLDGEKLTYELAFRTRHDAATWLALNN